MLRLLFLLSSLILNEWMIEVKCADRFQWFVNYVSDLHFFLWNVEVGAMSIHVVRESTKRHRKTRRKMEWSRLDCARREFNANGMCVRLKTIGITRAGPLQWTWYRTMYSWSKLAIDFFGRPNRTRENITNKRRIISRCYELVGDCVYVSISASTVSIA